jgi:hypothetical protein
MKTQNNFSNIFSIESNSAIPNINEPKNNNNFDLLSGFINMDSNNKPSINQNNLGYNILGNPQTTVAPSTNSKDLLSSLGLVRFIFYLNI